MAKKKTIKNENGEILHPVTDVTAVEGLNEALAAKQDVLQSGENIKTINGESILGSGNIIVDGGGSTISVDSEMSETSENPVQNKIITQAINEKQDTLVSGTNIKTVNGESLVGSGNIVAGDPNAVKYTEQTLTDEQKAQARTNIDSYKKPATGIPSTDLESAVQISLGKADSAYQKPGTGIPSSDMASAVQTSLGKADTAYQKPGTGIPSTDMASGVQTSLGKADTAYQKPAGGIPKSDLDSGVQESLDLADSAIQSEPVGQITPPVDPSLWATKEEVEELEHKVDVLESGVKVVEPTGAEEDVLFETNGDDFVGKIDEDGAHFIDLFIEQDENGAGQIDVAEELGKLGKIQDSVTANENEEIIVTDVDNNEVAKVNKDGITAKDVYVGGVPLSAFSFVGMTAIFDNWGLIGDSLTSGYLAAPDVGGESPAVLVGDGSKGRNIYKMSWGQILARMYGARATNFSVGGLTAKGWLDTYPGKTSENGYNSWDGTFSVTFNSQPKGIYTICLGTNDSADEITNPVGDVTTDIDTEDYHNNADTFAGNYAKIIQLCRELTPSCKIFVITPFSWWSYGAESKGYNDVVRAMPGIFDKVYLIDLYTDYYGHTPQYVYGGHGTTMGYVFTANAIAKAIDSIVRANEDDFKFQSIVTRARQDEGQY